ncbi:phosphonate ABC transporter, permease protein PhnE [Corynebacterium lowii]|uniref:Phosphate-import permease protein PhnE n=1 Tax=Corynebacterium lowii TaxID=1544413 RepID=A0A0Q0UFM2_9CORY|nr:phosphonate ABC transporter, permease protein PhnE [Corynebacterium lowii]KQB86876.1 Phosphate-import permease protein PhnE [Corynebacterium lowii]MDP9851564.1 phosphonate transport system permease protein [Corynebacterium lowii]
MSTINTAALVSPAPIPARPRLRRTAAWALGIAALVAVHAVAIENTEFYLEKLVAGWPHMVQFLADSIPPDLSWQTVLKPGLNGLLTTLWIGLLGTTLSVPLAAVLALGAARTVTSDSVVYHACRVLLSFLRAVPDIVFALIFVTAVGLGPFAGVMALMLHNTGVMGKLWAEAMEEADQGPLVALSTTGAPRLAQLAHSTLPVTLPQFVGLLLYRFDVNVRSSLVLGLVGAGGIGLLINRSIKTFQFDEMLTYIILVLILVVAVDQVSAWLRRRL